MSERLTLGLGPIPRGSRKGSPLPTDGIAGSTSRALPPLWAYPGVIHVHTRYSDGSGDFPQVTRAAREAGLRYIVITDHNTLQPLREGHQRYWDDLLVLVGVEISTDAGHYLAFGMEPDFTWDSRHAQTVIDRVRAAGGIGVIAHPLAARSPWTDWSVSGYAGMEVINLVSLAESHVGSARRSPLRIGGRCVARLGHLIGMYLLSPASVARYLLPRGSARERALWESLLQTRVRPVGIASTDAHASLRLGRLTWRVPGYRHLFESAQTYVLTERELSGDVQADQRLICEAYHRGRVYMVFPGVAGAAQFRFYATEPNAPMGDTIRREPGTRLIVEAAGSPDRTVRLLCDGEVVATSETPSLVWPVTMPGTYRVEVYARRPAPWRARLGQPASAGPQGPLQPCIYSNPIVVRG